MGEALQLAQQPVWHAGLVEGHDEASPAPREWNSGQRELSTG